jgi:hypothetical protein
MIISNESGLDHVAEEADIPTRLLLRRSLSVQWFSVIAQATVILVILVLRRSVSLVILVLRRALLA